MNGKLYLIVMCGAPDRPIAELSHRTPLEAAVTDNLDALAAAGSQGLVTVIDGGVCPESDSGIMALLGYDPNIYYTGRGGLEALGLGFMGNGERHAVGFRINFASYDARRERLDRRTARDLDDAELQQLVAEIQRNVKLPEGVDYSIRGFGRHRGIVCFRSERVPLNGNVSFTDPGFRKVGPFGVPNDAFEPRPNVCQALDESEGAVRAAELVNDFVRQSSRVLESSPVNLRRSQEGQLPANVLLFRDGGSQVPDLPLFRSRFGWTLSVYGQVPAEHGLCKLIGGAWHEARQEENQPAQDYYVSLAADVVQDASDVVVVHLKAPDEPAHDQRPRDKVAAIAELDREFIARLRERLGPDDTCVVTSDHSTPCELGIHSTDPVPVVVYSRRGVEVDDTTRFSEAAAARGGLPVRRAPDLFPHLHRILNA